jgi:hypothetical protein
MSDDDRPVDSGDDPDTSGTGEIDRTPRKVPWSAQEDEDAVVVMRGYPDQYDLNYLALLRLDPWPGSEEVVDMVCLASSNREFIEEIDVDQPAEALYQQLKDRRIELQLDGSGVDNQVIRDKYRSLFLDAQFATDLYDCLRENDLDEAKELLRSGAREALFPGSDVEQHIDIARWTSAQPPSTDSDSEDLEDFSVDGDGDSRMLSVSPKVRPFLGTEIGSLRPGDVFEVRVIGESATRLRTEFLDTNASDDNPYSRPLEARLISLEQGNVPQEIRFLVELADGVYGIGHAARDARVYHNEQLVRSNQPPVFYTLRIILFVASLVLLSSLILLFFVL